MLLRHLMSRADSRALPRDGSRIEISSAMIPITTRSPTSVNAGRQREGKGEPEVGRNGRSMGRTPCGWDTQGRRASLATPYRSDLQPVRFAVQDDDDMK